MKTINDDNLGNDFSRIDDTVKRMEKPTPPDVMVEWEKFETMLDDKKKNKSFISNTSLRIFSIAAAVLIIIGLGVVFNNRGTTYTTQNYLKELVLSDGSTIILNKNSQINYKLTYGLFNRNITLKGEAFFQVLKNGTVFRVNTDESCITVTGTQFNVKSDYNTTELSVAEGHVEFASRNNNQEPVRLTEGMYSSCELGQSPQKPVKTKSNEVGKWRKVKLVYKEETVINIVKDIQNTYKVDIKIANEETRQLLVTGILEGKNTKDLLKTLCTLIQKQYSCKDGVYEIY